MIAMLKGTVWAHEADKIILDVGGTGYLLHVTSGCAAAVRQGEERVFHTYLQVRDDDLALFGFNLKEEKELFLQLLSVSGIGPKAALSVLSTLTLKQIKLGIINEDVALLTQVPGIGPKSAKRIILELKEKIKDLVLEVDGENVEELAGDTIGPGLNEALDTLLALGFSRVEASSALHKVNRNKTSSTEDQVKEALRLLANR
ncbi:MAG: Holliday junction branch migration protein RuvA [Peptococcaceae bacterium]|nr:Holliday junction branch migration protein RuvA [Peptococcaceae bacterium]